jgi:hypothetical protein
MINQCPEFFSHPFVTLHGFSMYYVLHKIQLNFLSYWSGGGTKW